MKNFITNLLIALSFLVFTQSEAFLATAQTSFNLEKNNGHYFTKTSINGYQNVRIMVETGVPALVIDEDNFNKLCSSINCEELTHVDYTTLDSDRRSLNIKKVVKSEVMVGSLLYSGLIYIVEASNHIVVPFHRLTNTLDSTDNLICFNFKRNSIEFVNHKTVNLIDMNGYKIVQYEPMPIFESKLELTDTDGHNVDFEGKFVFDLGNASNLFLCRRSTLPLLKRNKFKILPSMDAYGNNIGAGIFVRYCRIGSHKKTGIPIGITNRSWDFENDIIGYVGPSFFNKKIIIIDPLKKNLYYK